MPYKILIPPLDYYESCAFQGVLASAPGGAKNGWTYINSGDNGYYIYYEGNWQLLHTLTGITYVTPSVGMPIGLLMALTYGFDA